MTDQSRPHVVVKLNHDGRLVSGAWTSQVFADLGEALAELAESESPDLWIKIF